MRFIVVAECRAVGYDSRYSHIGNGCGSVITPLPSGVRRCVDHYCFAQFVAVCPLDPGAGYLAYRRFAEIDWSS